MSVSDAEPLGSGLESSNPTVTLETLNHKLSNLSLEENRQQKLNGWDDDFNANEGDDEKKMESLNEEKPNEVNGGKWGWDDYVGGVEENVKFGSEEAGDKSGLLYPVRPDEPNCAYYMKTGTCKYGLNCKFNHPVIKTRNKVNFMTGSDSVQATEFDVNGASSVAAGQTDYEKAYKEMRRWPLSESNGQVDCKYYSMPGGCKYGSTCKYIHKDKTEVSVELNFLGLPMRPGEKECKYYMSTGSCKYSTNCRFHHPNPTAVGGQCPPGYQHGGSPQPYASPAPSPMTPWPLQQIPNAQVPYLDTPPSYAAGFFLPPQGFHPNPECNGYRAPVNPLYTEMHMPQPLSASPMKDTRKGNGSVPKKVPNGEYPERPGQPECQFFMKTGVCKFKSACKYHHPKSRLPKTSEVILSPIGLPLRPDQPPCTHFSRYGMCMYGRSCRYDHPMDCNPTAPPASFTGSTQNVPAVGDIRLEAAAKTIPVQGSEW